VATVDPQDAGSASAVISAIQRIGSAVGIAIIGSVLFGSLPTGRELATAAGRATGFTDASAAAMGVSAAFAVAAFLLVFALPRRVSHGRPPASAGRDGQVGQAPDGQPGDAGRDDPAAAPASTTQA